MLSNVFCTRFVITMVTLMTKSSKRKILSHLSLHTNLKTASILVTASYKPLEVRKCAGQ